MKNWVINEYQKSLAGYDRQRGIMLEKLNLSIDVPKYRLVLLVCVCVFLAGGSEGVRDRLHDFRGGRIAVFKGWNPNSSTPPCLLDWLGRVASLSRSAGQQNERGAASAPPTTELLES